MTAIVKQDSAGVPNGWITAKIGEICNVVTGGTPSTQSPEFYGGDISWLKSGDIKGLYIFITPEKLTQEGVKNSNAKIHPAGGVAIALSGRGQTRGRTVVIKKPMACSQSVAIMLPKDPLSPEFLHYSLAKKYLEIRNLTGDNDRSGLNLKLVSNIKIPLAPLPEQRRIATIITSVDDAIQRLRKATAETKRLKVGLMQELMTKGIGHTEFKNDPDVGRVPKEWEISRLDKFAEITMGQSPSGDTYNREKQGIPLINGPVEFGIDIPTPIQWTDAPTKICKREDILFCVRGNTTARINIADQPYCIGRGIAAIRGIDGISNTSFIRFAFTNRHDQIYQIAVGGGSTFPNITSKQLGELKLAFPSIKEQGQIVIILSSIDRKLDLQRQRTAYYEKLKQGLMNDLLTGNRRVQVT